MQKTILVFAIIFSTTLLNAQQIKVGSTAARASVQSFSPPLVMYGFGWKPKQRTTDTSCKWQLIEIINKASYPKILPVTSTGVIIFNTEILLCPNKADKSRNKIKYLKTTCNGF